MIYREECVELPDVERRREVSYSGRRCAPTAYIDIRTGDEYATIKLLLAGRSRQ